MNKTQLLLAILILFFSSSLVTGQTFADEITDYCQKGYIALKQQDYDTAIESFEKALKLLNIDPIEAGKEHKRLTADVEKNPKTKDGQDSAVVFNKLWLDTYYYLGLAYAYKGDKASALKQVSDLRHIGRDDYADSLEDEINVFIDDLLNVDYYFNGRKTTYKEWKPLISKLREYKISGDNAGLFDSFCFFKAYTKELEKECNVSINMGDMSLSRVNEYFAKRVEKDGYDILMTSLIRDFYIDHGFLPKEKKRP